MKIKRLTAFFTMLVMIISLFPAIPASAVSDSGTCGDNLTWEFVDGLLTISGTGDMEGWDSNRDIP